jgi:hypothetical protein
MPMRDHRSISIAPFLKTTIHSDALQEGQLHPVKMNDCIIMNSHLLYEVISFSQPYHQCNL